MASSLTDSRLKRIFLIHSALAIEPRSTEELISILEDKGLEVNDRMVKSDIKFLRELGAPIPSGSKHSKFHYSKPFSLLEIIEGVDFKEIDDVLNYIYRLYEREPNVGSLELDRIFLAFQKQLRLLDRKVINAVQFDEANYVGLKWLGGLIKDIQRERTIQFKYRPFSGEESDRVVFPLLLKEYNKRWFLIGLEKETRNFLNFALDRIVSKPIPSMEILTLTEKTDVAALFWNMIGVSPEGQPKRVRVYVANPRAKYISTKPWHFSQKEAPEEAGITFQWNIVINRELKAKILEHLPDIEVIEPIELKDWLKGVLQKSLEMMQ